MKKKAEEKIKTSDMDMDKLRELSIEYFNKLGLEDGSFQLEMQKDGDWISLNLACTNQEDQGLLIGRNGEGIYALQHILRLMAYRRFGQWTLLVLNIGGFLEERQQTLEKIANNLAQKVKFSNTVQELTSFNSAERRIIHMALKTTPT